MSLFNKQNKEALINPLNLDHPILVQVLGICSALAVTSQLKPAIVMGLAVTVLPLLPILSFLLSAIRYLCVFVLSYSLLSLQHW